jgi:hypothetical protein
MNRNVTSIGMSVCMTVDMTTNTGMHDAHHTPRLHMLLSNDPAQPRTCTRGLPVPRSRTAQHPLASRRAQTCCLRCPTRLPPCLACSARSRLSRVLSLVRSRGTCLRKTCARLPTCCHIRAARTLSKQLRSLFTLPSVRLLPTELCWPGLRSTSVRLRSDLRHHYRLVSFPLPSLGFPHDLASRYLG